MFKKINLMYHIFGKASGCYICKECSNFVRGQYNTKKLQKCKVYGLTHSQASDWAQKYEACGMFNKEWKGKPIIEYVRRYKQIENIVPKEQMTFEEVIDNA